MLTSGVVREEAGVGILRGNMDGERDEGRDVANGIGAVGTGAGAWEGWLWDIRFINFVSVGLTVLAPKPVACEV